MKKSLQICFLGLIYTLSHWLICFVSGQWWDDWIIWLKNTSEIKALFIEMGLPLEAYNLLSVMWLPNWGYRGIVFFLFFAVGVLFFLILSQLDFVTEEDAFWIAAVFMSVPVNDARITLICYGYTVSLFLFMLSFYLTTRLNKLEGKVKVTCRLIAILCLLYSYTMQSLLVFTGLIWLYLLRYTWVKNRIENKNIGSIIRSWVHSYWDYLTLPFFVFAFKTFALSPFGRYENYNDVSVNSLMKGLLRCPSAAVKTGRLIIRSYLLQISSTSIVLAAIIVVFFLIVSKKKNREKYSSFSSELKHILFLLILGCIVFLAGVFPYIVIRDGAEIQNTAVQGRDAILAGFGISIISYSLSRIIPVKKPYQKVLPLVLILMGALHFNNWYMSYQRDWYQQLVFAKALETNGLIHNEDDTILVLFSAESPVSARRFYTLNGMYRHLSNKQDKFFFSKIEDLRYGLKWNDIFESGYNSDEFDSTDMMIDGILWIKNVSLTNMQLSKLKYNELFHTDLFKDSIDKLSDYSFVELDRDKSDEIYVSFLKGNCTMEYLRSVVEQDNTENVPITPLLTD